MPRGDRTGPAGMGPMTGRGAGYCAGYPMPGSYADPPQYGLGEYQPYAYPVGGRGLNRAYPGSFRGRSRPVGFGPGGRRGRRGG